MDIKFLTALQKLQDSIGDVVKKSENPFFSSHYADLNALFEVVKPAIKDNGFILIQTVEGSTLRTQLVHLETGEMLEETMPLVTQKPDMQQFGSALTYARRYSLLPLLNIEVIDDDGNEATGKKKGWNELKTEEDFLSAISECSTTKQLGALYYKWKLLFPDNSKEYKSLSEASGNKKKQIEK